LMLREDVAAAIAKGRFHIYAVSSLDEGIEVLTGMPAGRRRARGRFTRGTVHYLVDEALRHFHEQLRNSEDGHAEAGEKHERMSASKERPRPPRPTRSGSTRGGRPARKPHRAR
jgi:hypothetical protein